MRLTPAALRWVEGITPSTIRGDAVEELCSTGGAETSPEKYQQDEEEGEHQQQAEDGAEPEAAFVVGVGVG